MDYQRNRLVLGGIFGILGCLILLFWSHPFIGVVVLLLGLLSSVRAVFNGAPIIGILLVKATGFMIVLYPMIWVAVEKFQKETAQYAQAQPLKPSSLTTSAIPPAEIKETVPSVKDLDETNRPTPTAESCAPPADESSDHMVKDQLGHVAKFVRFSREAEEGSNLDLVMSQYADSVQYFGQRQTKEEIRKDKAIYWEKWPTRSEEITSTLRVTLEDVGEFLVEFESSFRNENPGSGAWTSGDLSNRYTVNLLGEEFAVTAQSCEISNAQKGGGEEEKGEMLFIRNFSNHIIVIPRGLQNEIKVVGGTKLSLFELEAVDIVRKTLLAEEMRDIEKTISAYASEVKYFGTTQKRDGVRSDKDSYFTKWPTSEDERVSKYLVQTEKGRRVKVTFTTRFKVINSEGSVARSGEIDHLFRLSIEDKWLRIFEQSGKVKYLKTTKNPQ